ncbi:hypothetical protein MAPG_06145 [Magnaporthiopsis poae ATCC 64411]|uniref:Uncharacterized protein n=1 Tax=Magnaporthiopsis poae (strain ATCC 64411 / 73-15) TaxID=644358 RepID=A0A0C4E191_MAGP6|nr:hypothetical protein MAPG_06145 [Magnaporthiopsis poae ATCC 64411]
MRFDSIAAAEVGARLTVLVGYYDSAFRLVFPARSRTQARAEGRKGRTWDSHCTSQPSASMPADTDGCCFVSLGISCFQWSKTPIGPGLGRSPHQLNPARWHGPSRYELLDALLRGSMASHGRVASQSMRFLTGSGPLGCKVHACLSHRQRPIRRGSPWPTEGGKEETKRGGLPRAPQVPATLALHQPSCTPDWTSSPPSWRCGACAPAGASPSVQPRANVGRGLGPGAAGDSPLRKFATQLRGIEKGSTLCSGLQVPRSPRAQRAAADAQQVAAL